MSDALRNSTSEMTDADALRQRLAEDNAALIRRHDDLIGAEERLPDIVDDDSAGRVADYVKQATACAKALDGSRVAAKEPFLEGGRNVDGFFKRYTDGLGTLKRRVEAKLSIYLRDKADRERRAREEEARQSAEAARKAEAEAMALADAAKVTTAQADAALDTAVQAQTVARVAEKAAAAAPADLARTRGDFGSLATLRREWTFKDMDRAELDLEALRAHIPTDALEKALRSAIKAGLREIKGATIFENQTATVR